MQNSSAKKIRKMMKTANFGYVESSDPVLRRDTGARSQRAGSMDLYFSADIETDGPIPGPFSMLSFALVCAGSFDGTNFHRPSGYDQIFYAELRPISDHFQSEALAVNGIDRDKLIRFGRDPSSVMTEASRWIRNIAGSARPILVAYPLSFDWSWLYWYFTKFSEDGSPFGHSQCFDIKTALAIKSKTTISGSGRSRIPAALSSRRAHTHHAVDDAIEQAEIFANIFEWEGKID